MPGLATSASFEISILIPNGIKHHSGGNFYNKKMIAALEEAGLKIHIHSIHREAKESISFGNSGDLIIVDGFLIEQLRFQNDPRKKILLCHGDSQGNSSIFNHFDGIVAVGASQLPRNTPRASVIPPAIDHFPSIARKARRPCLQMVSVGAISQDKGQLYLLHSVQVLQHLPWELHLIGSLNADPDYVDAVEKFLQRLQWKGRVYLHGEKDHCEIAEVFSYSDIYLSCAPYETFGIAIQEAQKSKLPIANCADGYPRQHLDAKSGWQIHDRCPVILGNFLREKLINCDIHPTPGIGFERTWQQVGRDWLELLDAV